MSSRIIALALRGVQAATSEYELYSSTSIIILKDDAITDDPISIRQDLVRNLIKEDDRISHAYELLMEGETLNEQRTKIRSLV